MDKKTIAAPDLLAAAYHEAGHVWAYKMKRLPIRYVTVRPRSKEDAGRVQLHRHRLTYRWDLSFVAVAGPLAESLHRGPIDCESTHAPHELDIGTFDVVLGVWGECDYFDIEGYHLDETFLETLGAHMHREWTGISRLADALWRLGTVSGRDAFELLEPGQRAADLRGSR